MSPREASIERGASASAGPPSTLVVLALVASLILLPAAFGTVALHLLPGLQGPPEGEIRPERVWLPILALAAYLPLTFAAWRLDASHAFRAWRDAAPGTLSRAGSMLAAVGIALVLLGAETSYARLGLGGDAPSLLRTLGGWREIPGPTRALLACQLVLLAPLLEEWVFRGFLHVHLARRMSPWSSAFLGALLFALVHGARPGAVPPMLLLGLCCAWLRVRSGRLEGAILLHGLHNGAALLLLRFGG
jgi:hypothetical protein